MSEILHATQNWTSEQLELIEKYGTTDVYILQEGIDFVSENGVITELLRWDFGEQIIAFPEGISSTGDISLPYDSVTNYFEFLTCKKLILPKSMTYFNIVPLKINDIDTGNVETIYLNANIDNRDVSQGFLPSDICFNKHIKVVDIYYGSTNIHFNEVTLSNVSINIMIDGSYYLGHRIGIDFRNLNDYNIDANDYNSDPPVIPVNIYFYGYAGSAAEKYAKEHHIPFENIGSDCRPFLNNSITTEATISPNEYYIFTQIESLTVALDTASTTKLDEFMFSFETPSDISAFSFGVLTDESIEIKWVKEPNLKPDYVYEVSVVNGVGVIAGTAKEVTE